MPKPRRTAFCFLVAIAGSSACGLIAADPLGEQPAMPTRGAAPWRIEELTTCLGSDCSPEVASRISGLDLRLSGDIWLVLAAIDGAIHAGLLEQGWVLTIDPDPVLTPTQPWESTGLVDPEWATLPEGDFLLYGVADGSAIGWARFDSAGVEGNNAPLWRASDLGTATINAPGAVSYDGELLVAFGSNHTSLLVARGPALLQLQQPKALLLLQDVEADGWSAIETIDDPDWRLTNDGILHLFFAAHGQQASQSSSGDTSSNGSIGLAASPDGDSFELFASNPVHDRVIGLLTHGDESEPSVAASADLAIMLYRETTAAGSRPAVALHELR